MRVKQAVTAACLVLAFVYLVILQVEAIWPFTIDDMYITLRYAKNWVAGGELLWNMDSPPVEGYSNFSFLVLAGYVLTWGGDPVAALKWMGVCGLFFTILALYLLSRFWFGRLISLIPCVWLLLYRGQIIWSVSGLETTTYQALLALGLYCLLRAQGYKASPQARGVPQFPMALLAGFLFVLASMTRSEAPALIMLFYCLAGWDALSRQRLALRAIACSAMVYLVAYLPYFLWRWQYYGLLFSNPVYCKGHSAEWFILDSDYLSLAWPFLLLAIYGALRKGRNLLPWYFILPSVVYLLLLIRAQSLVAFDNRLFLPVFFLLLPVSLQGLRELVTVFLPRTEQSVSTATLLLASFFMAFFFIPMMTLPQLRYFTKNPVAGEKLRLKVVQWLNQHTSADSRIVLGDSGFIPYYSPLHYTDSYCLNNKAMAMQPQAERDQWFCRTILSLKPDVVILASLIEGNKVTYMPVDQCLEQALKTNSAYQLQALYYSASDHSAYRYQIFQLVGGAP